MPKIDLKKQLKHLYQPTAKEVAVVDVPEMNFLMIDGAGDPNTSQEYQEAIEALYAVAFTLKFMVKKQDPQVDYVVPPLEGLWWAEEMDAFTMGDKDAWKWTAMIMQPEVVTQELVDEAVQEVARKKDPAALPKIRFEGYPEGLSVQIMHIGPYSEEAPTIEKLHAFAQQNGYQLRGKHHEIYVSDPRRTAPDRLKTVIRQPVQ
ncbi:MAG: hypothetical protein GTO63_18555 [Anaerolineae bacterium]|nr:hypothetical protein [Anaerolineae bacterium]NIN96772.1 hypothetical protein [Anaerolineae bacterium]NIQ79768.1 hypothetical protein [Anaerolineae bacterium]